MSSKSFLGVDGFNSTPTNSVSMNTSTLPQIIKNTLGSVQSIPSTPTNSNTTNFPSQSVRFTPGDGFTRVQPPLPPSVKFPSSLETPAGYRVATSSKFPTSGRVDDFESSDNDFLPSRPPSRPRKLTQPDD